MAKFENVANELAKKFINASDKRYMLNSIVYDMNYLVYTETHEPLGYDAKSAIFKHIFDIVAGREKLELQEGEIMEPQFSDIIFFFERRNFILKQLKTGVRLQAQLN